MRTGTQSLSVIFLVMTLASPLDLSGLPTRIELAWPEKGSAFSIEHLATMASPSDAGIRRSLFSRFVDVVAGPPDRTRTLIRPFTLASDAHGRLAVVDPAGSAVHLYDPKTNKYRNLAGASKERFRSPIGADWDALGNLYVSDSELGKIFVFNRDGRFTRFIGALRGGEGYFKRPTGLAVDRSSGHIYLTDTLRHQVLVLDERGEVLKEWGQRGEGAGEFNYPTAVAIATDRVFVLDSMNFRVQAFTPEGRFLQSFGKPVNEPGGLFRPKGLAVDSDRQLVYVVDAMFELVQAFNYQGDLQFAFGHTGSGAGEFRLPAGICLQGDGKLLVADTYNGRIQVFQAGGPGFRAIGHSVGEIAR
ncbi:MAG: hypothetical protein HY821_08490 [Acidobacteria bacterium]|nr:hypothetical protein [Acidobacteriota bacterium]